ncbi:MAG: hypothetical protein AAGD43_03415 [Pseudomonadota bacterium]
MQYEHGRDIGQLQEWKRQSQTTLDDHGQRLSKLESRLQLIWRVGLVIVIWILNGLGLLKAEVIEKVLAANLTRWLSAAFL